MRNLKLSRRLAVLAAPILCASCSISVHAGYGNPATEQVYRTAIAQPFNNLTAAAVKANQVCAGGSQPNPQQCYADTQVLIAAVHAVERVLRSTPTPLRFRKANTDLLHGLGIYVQGLIERNRGLAAHSAAEYSASYRLIDKGLALQKAALAEYPAGANISG